MTVFPALRMLGLGAGPAVRWQPTRRRDAPRRPRPHSPRAQGPRSSAPRRATSTRAPRPVRRHRRPAGPGGWLHVDGAFGLWARPRPRRGLSSAAVERADSWTLDAHKWLNVPYDCGTPDRRATARRTSRDGARAAYLPYSAASATPTDLAPRPPAAPGRPGLRGAPVARPPRRGRARRALLRAGREDRRAAGGTGASRSSTTSSSTRCSPFRLRSPASSRTAHRRGHREDPERGTCWVGHEASRPPAMRVRSRTGPPPPTTSPARPRPSWPRPRRRRACDPRRRPESNRCTRLCRPLRSHSATAPGARHILGVARARPVLPLRPPRAISSAGRAPARQAGGHWFEPSIAHSRMKAPLRRGFRVSRACYGEAQTA